MATRIVSNAGKFIHDNYSAAVTPASKNAGLDALNEPYLINFLYIENMDLNIDIYVSFDGGSKWKTVKAGTFLSISSDRLLSYQVKAASGTPSVEAVYGVEI